MVSVLLLLSLEAAHACMHSAAFTSFTTFKHFIMTSTDLNHSGMTIARLQPELLARCFMHLDQDSKRALPLVCKSWQDVCIVHSDQLWASVEIELTRRGVRDEELATLCLPLESPAIVHWLSQRIGGLAAFSMCKLKDACNARVGTHVRLRCAAGSCC